MKLLILIVFALSEKIMAEGFEPVYTDNSNKLSWSKSIGKYSNGCIDANGLYDVSKCTFEIAVDGSLQVKAEDSDAAKACRTLGGGARLPTNAEWKSLIRNFDHEEGVYSPFLTDKGMEDMQIVFGDMPWWFWSSSIDSSDVTWAGFFYGFFGIGGGVDYVNRASLFKVRCVVGQ